MTNETISDIVREMREHASGDATETYYDRFAWSVLCDRIEAAAKREKELSLAICDKCEAGVFKAENDRLRAALKPVLSVRAFADINPMEILNSVREAHLIYHAEMNDDSIAAHNRVAKSVKESEGK